MSLAVFDGVSALIIDDVRFTSQRLLRTLEQIGIADTHAAPSGSATCKMIETSEIHPSLIIADFQMPEMNGLE